MIEPYRVNTRTVREVIIQLRDAGHGQEMADALQTLSQHIAVRDTLGEEFDPDTVDVFGVGQRYSPIESCRPSVPSRPAPGADWTRRRTRRVLDGSGR